MRKRLLLIPTILALLAFTADSICAKAKSGRAISLNALSSAKHNEPDSENLCGITKVLGYTIDQDSKDVILVGKVDSSLPPLHLEDFVVALRNAWTMYYKVQGNTRYYSAPGCSIDPDPYTLKQLNDVQHAGLDLTNKESLQSYSENWNSAGRQPQSVRVMGVPFDSRFARVMVDADYYMKRLVSGSVALDIDGFKSLTQMRLDAQKQDLASGKTGGISENSLSRFWFNPGSSTFEEKKGLVLLRDCSVVLLTEEEFLTKQNKVAGYGRPDPYARSFAESFTNHYQEIGTQRPIYQELEALYRFAAIARLLNDDRADSICKSGLGYLLQKYQVPVVAVSRAVKGLTDVRTSQDTIDQGEKKTTYVFLQAFCGGVCMDIRPKRIGVPASAAPAKQMAIRKSGRREVTGPVTASAAPRPAAPRIPHNNVVLESRKSSKQVSWDFSLDEIGE